MSEHKRIPLSEETSVAVELTQALASLTDSAALELPPLYEFIDPAAIESVFGLGSGDCLRFTYADQQVRLSRIDDSTLQLTLDKQGEDSEPQ